MSKRSKVTKLSAVAALLLASQLCLPGLSMAIPSAYNVDFIGGQATDLNNHGQVVGQAWGNNGQNAFLWDKNGMLELGTFGEEMSEARSINNLGQLTGITRTASFDPETGDISFTTHNFEWDKTLGYQEIGISPYANNNAGYVAGYGPAIWSAKTGIQKLEDSGSMMSFVSDINGKNQVVGTLTLTDPNTGSMFPHAVLWNSPDSLQDLGALDAGEYSGSHAYAINNLGQVVGKSNYFRSVQHAVIWDSVNGIQDLGAIGGSYPQGESAAFDINRLGQIVGETTYSDTEWQTHAFLYENGNMFDLNNLIPADLNVELIAAHKINVNGQILAETRMGDSVLLTPNSLPAPEPASMLLLASGLVGMLGIKSRKN